MTNALPPLRFLAGLHTTPLEASNDHVVDSINVYSHNGRLEKRKGGQPIAVLPGLTSQPTVGWSNGWVTEPTTVSAVASLSPPYWFTSLYVGYSSTFNRADVVGSLDGPGALLGTTGFWARGTMDVEYWNGTAWVDLPCGDLFEPRAEPGQYQVISPWHNITTADPNSGNQGSLVFDPPSDWATKNIAASGAKYWIRFRGLGWAAFSSGSGASFETVASVTTTSCTVQTTENRVLHINAFRDRNGQKHLFSASLHGSDGTAMTFVLDGVTMSQAPGLSPDGTAVMFSESTVVESVYDAATDSVIGFVSGLGWFYFRPGEVQVDPTSSARTAEIYAFELDPVGTDTDWANEISGLRSAIPAATVMAHFDDRLFAFNGNTFYWSSPERWKDIWPFSNEGTCADAEGNITGAVAINGILTVFKRNSIWIVQSTGVEDGYYATRVPGSVGCVSGRSIASTGNQVFFAAEDGIYTFDGSTVAKVSGDIEGLWQDRRTASNMERSVGVYYAPDQQYRLFFPSSASSWVLDSALYADIYGWVERVTGKSPEPAAWWKQGKYADTDYGFNATAIASDSTSDKNRMLIGDRYGVIWEADTGTRDAGSPIKMFLTSKRFGLGSAQKVNLRWSLLSQRNNGLWDTTVTIWPEGREDQAQTDTVNPYPDGADGSVFTAAGAFTADGTFSYSQDEAATRSSFAVMGKWFQVKLSQLDAAAWEFEALELEINVFGRRTS